MLIETNWKITTKDGKEEAGYDLKEFEKKLDEYGLDIPKLSKQPRMEDMVNDGKKCITVCRSKNQNGFANLIMVIKLNKFDIERGEKTAKKLQRRFNELFAEE